MISEDSLYKFVGARLKESREKRPQLTQEKLADEIGLKRTSITNIESGQQRVPLHVLFRICEVLRIEVRDLLPQLSDIAASPNMVPVTIGQQTTQVDSKTAEALDRILSSQSPLTRKK